MILSELAISALPHTSPRTVKLLQNLRIYTYQDLLDYYPSRYVDYSHTLRILDAKQSPQKYIHDIQEDGAQLISTGKYSLKGIVERFHSTVTQRRITIQKASIRDESGSIEVTWFNQPYLRSVLKVGSSVSLSGCFKRAMQGISFFPEEFEILTDQSTGIHTARIVPVYSLTRGISSKTIREKISYILDHYKDSIELSLPQTLLDSYKLPTDRDTYQNIHFPSDAHVLTEARHRKAFEELLTVQVSSLRIKQEWQQDSVPFQLRTESIETCADDLIATLPFTLTQAQSRVVNEVMADLSKTTPMNRLVQGDVGSGKTVIAAIAAHVVNQSGLQTVLMAPTEILAQQHLASLESIFKGLPTALRPKIQLITRNNKPSSEEIHSAQILVGTHALITQKIKLGEVGLVIVDEQHKFGVAQRAALKAKGLRPHLLSMTATPIPRTVMLTLHGELELSIVDELPEGRKTIKSYSVPPHKRDDAYNWIRKEIAEHKTQVFLVCPLIDESNAESMQNVKAVTKEFEYLSKEVFPELSLALLHGKLKKAEKDEIMEKFSKGKFQILVSTPVIEVGIDIPNATIMVIEASERFGLAQLHQLRGRVGRSDKQSYCLLFTESNSPLTLSRLSYFAKTASGFQLAEYDLKHRGGGDIFGTQQHGSDFFKLASFADTELIAQTKAAAQDYMLLDKSSECAAFERRLEKYRITSIAPN